MIQIGIIGAGGMAKWHAEAFAKIKGVRIAACCDALEERARRFAKEHNIPTWFTDYRQMLAKEPLDGIANVTPDPMHAEISLAVIDKGIAILCEKPLATSLADARKMSQAAQRKKVINMVNFSYRNSCALQAASRLVAAGKIGRVMHVESSYLQSWLAQTAWGDWRTSSAFTWRLSKRHGSAGVLGDVGCHIYDLTTFLVGDIDRIQCKLLTFDKDRPRNRIGPYVLDANDSFISTAVFKNGAGGAIHSTRWATGHLNSLRCRVFGDEGAVEIDLDSGYDIYKICRGTDNLKTANWETVKCKPTPNNHQRFVQAIRSGKNDPSDFANGAKIQAYLHYSIESDESGLAMKIKF